MKYAELIILAPCYSLEDFPMYPTGAEADGLLAAWTSLWHPALLAAAGGLPTLVRADTPPDQVRGRLLVVPTAGEAELDAEWPARAELEEAVLIRGRTDRPAILAHALQHLDGGDAGVPADLAEDFFALGFCYLQVQLLTRQMRYSSSLDEGRFRSDLLSAARAALQDDGQLARQHLAGCFDALADERNHYYPVDVYLVDLTVVAPETFGPALRAELAAGVPGNWLISGQTLQLLAEDDPPLAGRVREAVAAGSVGLIGGEQQELPQPLLSPETSLRQLRLGWETCRRVVGRPPAVFGRRRFGLTPDWPQLLSRLGYRGGLHATLDDGRFPESSQSKTCWEGSGGGCLDALARVPLDAARPESFLNLPAQLSESMDMDHVATRCFAHWPGRASPWYEDLRRAARFGTALGKFVTLATYFEETADTGQHDRFADDAYRSPYLQQAVSAGVSHPISWAVRYWRQLVAVDRLRGLLTLLTGTGMAPTDIPEAMRRIEDLACRVDGQADYRSGEPDATLDRDLADCRRFLLRSPDAGGEAPAGHEPSGGASERLLVLNPCSFVRRMVVETSSIGTAAEVRPVYAAGPAGQRQLTIVDVPPMGLALLAPASPTRSGKRPDRTVSVVEDNGLRNEFLTARIDPATGALQSLADYTSGRPRLSQKLALRSVPPRTGHAWIDRKRTASYSVMAADEVTVTENGMLRGEITTRGRLLDEAGHIVARFVQRYALVRGSRVLELEIELRPEPGSEPGPEPWESYFACRFAWPDESALVARGTRLRKLETTARRLEAPLFVEIDSGRHRAVILTGGLPFHRRIGSRALDTLLIVRGETERNFRIGLGLDVAHPVRAAWQLLDAEPLCLAAPPTVTSPAAWLFHIDARNIIVTHWEPLIGDGALRGCRLRLLETEGHAARVRLRAFRSPRRARLLGFDGQPVADCHVEEDTVHVEMQAGQWRQLEVVWD
jgi:alpha-mannosidase